MSLAFRLLGLLIFSFGALYPQASPRLNDKDLERLMKNVNQDAKRFAESFKKAIDKSSMRKTSRAKEAEDAAKRFVAQTEGMAKKFENKRTADQTLPVVYQSVGQLDKLIRDFSLQGVVISDWQKVTSELDQVAQQFSYTPPTR